MTSMGIAKILRTMCLAAVTAAAAGCVAEDTDGCPPAGPNVEIRFSLLGGGVFSHEIGSVVAVLFDGQGNHVPPATTLDADALESFRGVRLTLPAGDYRMVLWANVGDNTEIGAVDGEPAVVYNDFDGTKRLVAGNGDAVWYAPAVRKEEPARAAEATRVDPDARPLRWYGFTVTEEEGHTGEVAFTEAHNTVNIYIGGFAFDPGPMPTVEITGLVPGVGFWGMQPLGQPLPAVSSAVRAVAVERDDRTFALASFHTFPLGDMAGMWIVVRDAAGDELLRMPLADVVALGGIDPGAHELNPFLYFGELNVGVKIGDWNRIDLGKEWWEE